MGAADVAGERRGTARQRMHKTRTQDKRANSHVHLLTDDQTRHNEQSVERERYRQVMRLSLTLVTTEQTTSDSKEQANSK